MRIFISYAKEDADHADRLYRALSEIEELSPWLDRQNLLPGSKWKDEILSAIEESRFVALILSTRSVSKTGFVQKEYQTAIDRLSYHPPGSTFLIPVRIEPCSPKHRELSELQFVDMFPHWETGLAKIKKAITTQIDNDLGVIFEQLRICHHSHYPKEKEWVDSYADKVLAYSAPSLIRAIDKANERYSDELYCLRVIADLAKKADSSLLYDVVIRMHEIVKLCQFEHEIPSFFGVLIYGASLLGNSARAMFLRAAVDFWIEHMAEYNQGSWWCDFAFRDLVKHFIATETSTYISGQTMSRIPHFSTANVGRLVIDRCLPLISWDIARADFLTFWARRTGRFLLLVDVANHLLSSFGRRDYGSDAQCKWRPDVPLLGAEGIVNDPQDRLFGQAGRYHKELHRADYREDYHRLGVLMRIAEYLRYLEGPSELTKYATHLNAACMDVIRTQNDRIWRLLINLSDHERRRLFWLIERQDFMELKEIIGSDDWNDCKFLLDFVPHSSEYHSKEADKFLPITLPKSAVPLRLTDGSPEDFT